MAKNTEENQLTSRQRLAERYKGRDPEINVEDDEALGAAILGDLDAYDQGEEQRKRFNESMQSSGIAPEMMAGVLSGKNPDGTDFDLEDYLLEQHLDYLLDVLENKETAKEKASARKKAREDEAAANAEFEAKAKDLIAAEDAELDAAIAEAGYKPEQVKDLIDWIYDKEKGFITRAKNFELKKDDFLRLFKIKDYDIKMSEAEDKGYKRGRNEKIDMFRRGQQKRDNMPADIDGGGGAQPTEAPKEDPTMSALKKMKRAY